MMDKILDGDDFAHDHDYINYETLLRNFADKARRADQRSKIKAWDGKTCAFPDVYAYISGGRWLAKCWCGQVGYVSRRYAFFFCLSCGNEVTGGAAAPVVFPIELNEIEAALLARPVQAGPGKPTLAARTAVSLTGLPREWLPGQSVDYLRKKNREMGV